MVVYVDNARNRFGRMLMCHMMSDMDPELRAMARAIGVSERWHQGDHFDICQSKRALAIEAGAVSITQRQMVEVRRRNRESE
jgi:hypothetical protein